jgi:hypothetical protein
VSARFTPRRVGSIAAFVAAAAAIAAAVAGGVTEPTGIAAAAAIVAVVLAYGLAPLVISVALRLSALASWWAVAAGLLAALLWTTVAMLLAVPALLVDAPAIGAVLVDSVSISSALWIIVASLEVVRVGVQRWTLVILAGFVAVLMIGSLFIEQGGFDVTMVAVPLGWAAWMIDLGRALRSLMNPRPASVDTTVVAPCANCGAPRRRDGLAFCAECGLPYGASRSDG